jgi:hypothetical protein
MVWTQSLTPGDSRAPAHPPAASGAPPVAPAHPPAAPAHPPVAPAQAGAHGFRLAPE